MLKRQSIAALALLTCWLPARAGNLPVSGMPTPELAAFDTAMQNFMQQYSISCGVLGVIKDGCIVYLHGFGYLNGTNGVAISENTPMRIASVEKPLTAAAIRIMAGRGLFNLGDNAFNLGQPGGGRLNIQPFNGTLGDNRLNNVTIMNMLDHQGGWDRQCFGDPPFMAITIANALGIASPPGRTNTVRYMLAQALQYTPGTATCSGYASACPAMAPPPGCYNGDQYSNFAYMCLGLLGEQMSGQQHDVFIENNVFSPDDFAATGDIFRGRTFQANQSPREPVYTSSGNSTNVFNPGGSSVPAAYGGWEQEVMVGHGNLVCTASVLLRFLTEYTAIGVGSIGMPYTGTPPNAGHWGALNGTHTAATQRNDGIHVVVLFNKSTNVGSASCMTPPQHYAGDMTCLIYNIIDAGGFTWPTRCVDGFWVDFSWPSNGPSGGFNDPFNNMNTMLATVGNNAKIHFQAHYSNWTGTINRHLRLDAPWGGVARLGQL